VALGQVLAQQLGQGLGVPGLAPAAAPAPTVPATAAASADEVMALLEKLGQLKAKGILTDEEFAAKKAELLSRL
jgi:hypothetical protein